MIDIIGAIAAIGFIGIAAYAIITE